MSPYAPYLSIFLYTKTVSIIDDLDITNRPSASNLNQASSLWERRRSGSIYAKWSQEEDDMLRACVARHGNSGWEKVASDIPSRSYHQCRQRWMQLTEEKMGRSSMDASHSPAISNLLTQQQPSLGSPSPPRSAAQDDEPRTPPHQIQYSPTHEIPRKTYEPYSTNLQERHSQYAPSSLNRQETLPTSQNNHSGLYRPPSPIATPKKRKIETMP
jgi:Myb-like DNA-binding domain